MNHIHYELIPNHEDQSLKIRATRDDSPSTCIITMTAHDLASVTAMEVLRKCKVINTVLQYSEPKEKG